MDYTVAGKLKNWKQDQEAFGVMEAKQKTKQTNKQTMMKEWAKSEAEAGERGLTLGC